MTLIALVDGGGTKTRVRFLNQSDQSMRSEVVTGPSNLGLGASACWSEIQRAIELAGVSNPVQCIAGMAGSEYVKERTQFLQQAPFPTILVSDRDSGLFGAHQGDAGGCLTVGTGVALAWIDEARMLSRRGGFGFVLGDQGGGAWIGWRLLQQLVQVADRGEIADSHFRLIAELGIGSSVGEWMQFANQAGPKAFASLARPVVESEHFSALSRQILDEGLQALVSLLQDFPKQLPLALVGGLANVYGPRLIDEGYSVRAPKGDALDGLSYIDHHLDQLTVEYWTSHD